MAIFIRETRKVGAIAVFALMAAGVMGITLGSPALPRATAQDQPAAPKGDAQKGKQLYMSYGCYQCHGRSGQGAAATGPRLGPKPIPFAQFLHQLRDPSDQMPPYTAKVTSDSQVADIYAYLQSIPAPPKVSDIPLLQ